MLAGLIRAIEYQEFGKGTLETVEGFEPAFQAEIVHGADYLSFNSDNKHAHIDVKAIAE